MDTWHLYQKFILPDGEAAYPQGMDWELHNLPYFNLFASLACYKKDPLAARMESQSLQLFRAWQEMSGDGSLTFPGSRLGFTRHACTIDQLTWAFLAHKIFGPATEELSANGAESIQDGVNTYRDVAIVTHRTDKKFVSFSWTNHVMGMVIPIGAGHESNPDFTAPIRDGFVGSFDTGAKPSKPVATVHDWKTTSNGFETSGDILLNNGQLKQTVHVTSIGPQTVIYEDRVTALRDVTIKQEQGIPLGIENDRLTGGTRVLYYQGDSTAFNQDSPQKPFAISGSWANVDRRLGLIVVAGSGISYNQAHGYAPGISICEDVLYGSYVAHPRHFKAGNEVAHRIAILVAEVTPEQTAAIARSVTLKEKGSKQVLRFELPDGTPSEIHLN